MKLKNLKRKLSLNKLTVSNLNGGQMRGVHGGTEVTLEYTTTCNCTSHKIVCKYTCGCPASNPLICHD